MCVCVCILVCHLNNFSSEWSLPRGVLGNGICAAQMGAQLALCSVFPFISPCSSTVPTFFTFAFRICDCKCVGVSVFVCLFVFLANTFVSLRCVNIKAIINLIEVPFELSPNFIFMQSLEICLISSHHTHKQT